MPKVGRNGPGRCLCFPVQDLLQFRLEQVVRVAVGEALARRNPDWPQPCLQPYGSRRAHPTCWPEPSCQTERTPRNPDCASEVTHRNETGVLKIRIEPVNVSSASLRQIHQLQNRHSRKHFRGAANLSMSPPGSGAPCARRRRAPGQSPTAAHPPTVPRPEPRGSRAETVPTR